MRTFQPGFIDNFLKVVEDSLCQFWVGRALFGGTYVRLVDHWSPVDVLMTCNDGTRVFMTQYTHSSFHESFVGISNIQEFV